MRQTNIKNFDLVEKYSFFDEKVNIHEIHITIVLCSQLISGARLSEQNHNGTFLTPLS